MFMNKRPIFVLFVLLQFVFACSPSGQNMQGEHWVIFSEKQAEESGIGSWFAQGDEPIQYWTPVEENILALEDALGAYLQDNPDRFRNSETPVWERLNEYNRQYIGIILDGKQIIYANYFCDSVESDWKKDFVFVMDGGECFFQFKYEVESAEFFDLQVNGEA